MAFASSQESRLLVGPLHLSTVAKSVGFESMRDMLDATVLTDRSRVFRPGVASDAVNVTALFDNDTAADAVVPVLQGMLGAATPSPLTIAPAGFDVGNHVWLANAREERHEPTSSVDELVALALQFGCTGPAAGGLSLADLATVTATSNGSAVDLGAAGTNGAIAHLHVTAASGTSPQLTVTVEHSTTGVGSWSTLATFTAATAAGAERVTVAGTVNRYVRAVFTIAGTSPSFTCHVAVAKL